MSKTINIWGIETNNLKNIDQIYNHPLEIYYDAENIYLLNKELK